MFVCNIGEAALALLIERIAPRCLECHCAMTQLCVEECCQQQPLFCNVCSKDQHFLHLTNDLCLLFTKKDKVCSTEQFELERLGDLLEFVRNLKAKSEEIIQSQLRLIDLYETTIKEISHKIENCFQKKWYGNLYDTVERVIRERLPAPSAQQLIGVQLGKMDLHYFSQVKVL